MNITKESVDALIERFRKEKDSLFVTSDLLTKFDAHNQEHRECLTYVSGKGGYYMLFLKYLIENLDPKNIVELGSQTGMSTLAMYSATKKDSTKKLYTADIEKDQRFCPDEMFSNENVTFIFGDVCSHETIQKLPRSIDLLFTDTLHYNFQLEDEYEIYQHLLSDVALVAIDDIRSNDKGLLFDSLPFSKWDLTELCHVSGWGLFLFERKIKISKEEQEENLQKTIFKVWERKFYRVQQILDIKNITVWTTIKTQLKKLRPLYIFYTKIYNKIHHVFFSKKVKFYKR